MTLNAKAKRNNSAGMQRTNTGNKDRATVVLGLLVVVLIGTPLVLWSATQVRVGPAVGDLAQRDAVLAAVEQPLLEPALPTEAQPEATPPAEVVATALAEQRAEPAPDLSALSTGHGELSLNALAQGHSIDEVDNVLWSLVRRTPKAAEVYGPETGVNWEALRQVSESGTIYVPAGFVWSFNETFQEGPGYKNASGILAGGHCALATVFRRAAVEAGLSISSRVHRTPIPGYSHEDSVNILWRRDDLLVHNTGDQDLYFQWKVSPEMVAVDVVPVTEALPLPQLPDWRQGSVALVYGRPGPGGWGSLGQTTIVDHGLHLARLFAGRVDEWNGEKAVAVAVNPNVVMAGKAMERDVYLYHLIAEARRQGFYVMLDVQPGAGDPLAHLQSLMDKFLQEHVWFDWDIEHTAGGRVEAALLNRAAEAYFERRKAEGYQTPGIFGFYVFKENQVINPGEVRREYDGGVVVPIFDGFGGSSPNPGADKIAKTRQILGLFGDGPEGVMEFETRWGTRYDKISAQEYFAAFPTALIFASQ